MKLYSVDLSPFAARCRMALYLKGLEDQCELALPLGRPDSDVWRAVNPIGKIPALDVGGRVLAESEVILEYLEDRFPEPSLRPANLEDRALARTLSRICDLYVLDPLFPLFALVAGPRDQGVVDAHIAKVRTGLGRLEAFLPDVTGPFALGARPSTADCALVGTLFYVEQLLAAFGVTDGISSLPRLNRYWQAINTEPTGARVLDELLGAFEIYRETGDPTGSRRTKAPARTDG